MHLTFMILFYVSVRVCSKQILKYWNISHRLYRFTQQLTWVWEVGYRVGQKIQQMCCNTGNIFLQHIVALQIEKRFCIYYNPPQSLSRKNCRCSWNNLLKKRKCHLNLPKHTASTSNNEILLCDNVWYGW